jgi:hypothetical protein
MKNGIIFFLCFACVYSAKSQIVLERRTLLSGKIQLLVPSNFSDKYVEQKKSKEKIEIDLTNADQSTTLDLSVSKPYFESDQLPQIKDSTLSQLKKFDPSSKLRTSGFKKVNGIRIAFITYKSSLGSFSHIFFAIKNKELYWFILTAHKNEKQWEKIFDQISLSLRIN